MKEDKFNKLLAESLDRLEAQLDDKDNLILENHHINLKIVDKEKQIKELQQEVQELKNRTNENNKKINEFQSEQFRMGELLINKEIRSDIIEYLEKISGENDDINRLVSMDKEIVEKSICNHISFANISIKLMDNNSGKGKVKTNKKGGKLDNILKICMKSSGEGE